MRGVSWLAGLACLVGLAVANPFHKKTEIEQARADAERIYGPIHTSSRDVDLFPTLVGGSGLHKYRTATVEIVFPRDAFNRSWRTYGPELLALAKRYADRECASLLATVASKCGYSSNLFESWVDFPNLKLRLMFVPRTEFGAPPQSSEYDLFLADLAYDKYRALNELPPLGDQRGAREAIYRRIAKDCDKAKSLYGNCLLVHIRIRGQGVGPIDKPRQDISGTATIAVLHPHIYAASSAEIE